MKNYQLHAEFSDYQDVLATVKSMVGNGRLIIEYDGKPVWNDKSEHDLPQYTLPHGEVVTDVNDDEDMSKYQIKTLRRTVDGNVTTLEQYSTDDRDTAMAVARTMQAGARMVPNGVITTRVEQDGKVLWETNGEERWLKRDHKA